MHTPTKSPPKRYPALPKNYTFIIQGVWIVWLSSLASIRCQHHFIVSCLFVLFFFIYREILPACMFVNHMHVNSRLMLCSDLGLLSLCSGHIVMLNYRHQCQTIQCLQSTINLRLIIVSLIQNYKSTVIGQTSLVNFPIWKMPSNRLHSKGNQKTWVSQNVARIERK